MIALAMLATLLAAAPDPAPAPAGLADRLQPLIAAHRGTVAVAVKHLGTGAAWSWHADEPMPTASLIKLAVMIEAYRQAAEGKVDLDRTLTLRKEDKVPGSGILTQLSDGATFPLRDAIRLMIALSDNTATNMVLDQISIAATGETMAKLGCPNTQIHAKVFRRDTSIAPERSKRFGLGSTTAGEMVRLLELLQRKEVVNPAACDAMLAHLKACADHAKLSRYLPDGTVVACKTGYVDSSHTAAGILFTPSGPIAICVLTDENEDQRYNVDNAADLLSAKIAREVYDAFNPPAK